MIVETFDQGWGPEWPAKQFENNILKQYFAPITNDDSKTVVINSTWYTQDYHEKVLERLHRIKPDRVLLVAMLDFAIPHPQWFESLGCEVRGVGYYCGVDEIDYWALVSHQNMMLNDVTADIDTAYMCLNRKPHWHRMKLYQSLESLGLLDAGIVSMGGENGQWLRLLPEDAGISNIAPNAGSDQYGIANDIMSLGHTANWQRHFLNIVTETIYNIGRDRFVTEKIYKPILGERVFLVYAEGADQWLKEHGFVTFSDDFGDITSLNLALPDHIPEFLKILVQQGSSYWKAKHVALQDKIQYNKIRFREYVTETQQKISQGILCQI